MQTLTSTGIDPEGGQHRCIGRDVHRFHRVIRPVSSQVLTSSCDGCTLRGTPQLY